VHQQETGVRSISFWHDEIGRHLSRFGAEIVDVVYGISLLLPDRDFCDRQGRIGIIVEERDVRRFAL
jgi:hypothetical protein